MRTTIVTCVLVAASASLVSAAPGPEETTERIGYNEHAKPQRTAAPEPGWVELASATPASHGRELVVLGADAGTYTQLRITAAAGRPQIRSVRVDYQDGSHKVFRVDRVLDAKRRPAYLDLRGPHELKQIVVTTDRTSRGSYVLVLPRPDRWDSYQAAAASSSSAASSSRRNGLVIGSGA